MAELKAYAKGTTDSVEWTLHSETDTQKIATQLAGVRGDTTVTVPTSTGWVRLRPQDWAALEVVE